MMRSAEAPRGAAAPSVPVAVVIVAWNSRSWIADCLDSLRSLEAPPAETVVVDNGSSDGTAREVRARFPDVRVMETGANLGYCRGNNLGLAATSSPFVLLLNPDTRLAPAFLKELLPAFDDPEVGIAAGKLLRFDGRTLDSAGQLLARSRRPVDRGYGRIDRGQFDRDEEVFGACGAAALYRRSALEMIARADGQVFDETFFAFYEDLDVAWRARRAGFKAVYRHRALGFHARGGSSARPDPKAPGAAFLSRSPELRFHIVKNRYLTITRNESVAAFARNLPFILGREALVLAVLFVTSPGVLVRLWRERRVFRQALKKRRLDEAAFRDEVVGGGDR